MIILAATIASHSAKTEREPEARATLTVTRDDRAQAQDPLPTLNRPPAGPVQQSLRGVSVDGGAFRDWFAPHDVHLCRFQL